MTATTATTAGTLVATSKPRSEPNTLIFGQGQNNRRDVNQYDIANNAVWSPLLRLPAELRNRIWEDLLTGHSLHIARHKVEPDLVNLRSLNHPLHWSGDKSWGHFEFTHTICQAPYFEDGVYQDSLRSAHDGSLPVQRRTSRSGHRACIRNLDRIHIALDNINQSKPVQQSFSNLLLPVQLLRVCHKIYWETHTMPYNGNKFHFSSPIEFFEWSYRAISNLQRRALRDIQITNSLHNPVQPLQGMRNLEPGTFARLTDLTLVIESECLLPGLPQNPFCNCRGLKNVKVICGSASHGKHRENAEEIERALLRR